MQIDMRTVTIEPQRKAYDHLQERFGDKVPSRYQEATYDLQVTENIHYRPTWDPEQELYDKNLSKIRMEDWYALKDPRQFYYSTYTLARARQQEAMESNFKFVESRGLIGMMSEELREKALNLLLPLRHVNWAANLNNTFVCGYGYGTAFTQPCIYHAVDNLGLAQYLSRLGLLLGGKASLAEAKQKWMEDVRWQPLRRFAEDSMVVRDPVQLFVIQNVCLDSMIYPLIFGKLVDGVLSSEGGSAVSLLTQFATGWHIESRKWVDSVIKTMAKESDENAAHLTEWVNEWSDRASAAVLPVCEMIMGDRADDLVQDTLNDLRKRMKKAGLAVGGDA